VGRRFCGEFGSANAARALFLTRDGGSSKFIYFDAFPCDCTDSNNETEFDACVDRGDLGGGCVCLDVDLDGDVDCNDFDPPISQQCSEPVPMLSGWRSVAAIALLLLVSTRTLRFG
jgi:hypothetical protein